MVLLVWPQVTVMTLLVASSELGVEHANVSPYVRRRMLELRMSAFLSQCQATHAPEGDQVAQTLTAWKNGITEQINAIVVPEIYEELDKVNANHGCGVNVNAGGV